MQTRQRRTMAGLVLASGVLLAGCASGPTTDGSGAPASGGAVTPASFDKQKAATYLLTAADVTGYTALPKGAMDKGFGAQAGGMPHGDLGDITVEPAACKSAVLTQVALNGNLKETAKASAATALAKGSSPTDATLVAEAIGPTPQNTDALYDQSVLEACSAVTVTADGKKATISLTPVPVSDVGDRSVGVQLEVTTTMADQDVTLRSVVITVEQGDKTLLVSLSSAATGAADLRTEALKVADQAYAKAADFLAA